MKTGIQLIRDYFGDVRPVGMDEMKKLTKEDRAELAGAIAAQQGLRPVTDPAGTTSYAPAA